MGYWKYLIEGWKSFKNSTFFSFISIPIMIVIAIIGYNIGLFFGLAHPDGDTNWFTFILIGTMLCSFFFSFTYLEYRYKNLTKG